jgi:hypothetical protein
MLVYPCQNPWNSAPLVQILPTLDSKLSPLDFGCNKVQYRSARNSPGRNPKSERGPTTRFALQHRILVTGHLTSRPSRHRQLPAWRWQTGGGTPKQPGWVKNQD